MSIISGPNSNIDGLVLCLDAYSARSFKGEPTTNNINYASPGANRYNNPGFSGTITNTGKTFLGSPIWEVTFIPQTSNFIPRLGSTEGFGFINGMGTILLANTQYMASVYFQSKHPLQSTSFQGFNNTYSNIIGWGYDQTSSARYQEGPWTRLYTKFLNSILINNEYYSDGSSTNVLNAIVNTTSTTDILLTITILANGTFSTSTDFGVSSAGGLFTQFNTLVGIRSADPIITSNGGISGLSTGYSAIIQHGLDPINWTKLSNVNNILKTNFPITYYVLVRIPSTGGSDVTIGIRPNFRGFYSSLTDGKYWKITFDTTNIQVNDVIRTYWAAPMIEQHARDLPSKFVIGSRGSTVSTNGGWADLSNSNNNITLTSTPSFSINGNGSLLFNGVDQYIQASNMSRFNSNSNITIEAFVYPISLQSYACILERGYPSPGFPSYTLRRQSGYGWSILIGDNTNQYAAIDPDNITLNTWQHVVGVLNRQTNLLKIYVNGVEKDSVDCSGLGSFENAAGSLTIGRSLVDVSYGYFHGNISLIRVYNTALSTEQVKQNFESIRGRFGL